MPEPLIPIPPDPVPVPPAPSANPLRDLLTAELVSILKGGGVAAAGAVLAWLATVALPMLQAASPTPGVLVLIVLLQIGVNVGRKVLANVTIKLPPAAVLLLLLPVASGTGCGSMFRTGEPAKAVITGTSKVAPHGLVRLSAEGSTGQLMRWEYDSTALDAAEFDDGRTLSGVARTAGSTPVRLEVLSIQDGRLRRDTASVVVEVAGPIPGPGPPVPPVPGPTPVPVPPAPSPGNAFADFARDRAVALVQSPNRKAEAVKMAGICRETAAGIEAGRISTGTEVGAVMTASVESAFGAAARPWNDWLKAVFQRLNDVCPDLPSAARALREVAGGLETVT